MGNVTKTSNTTNNIDASKTDNSSTVNNTTTYNIMNGNKVEYCKICGNTLEEKHARCPKCGKEICMACKVDGKNRCIECEKQAETEYKNAFQELILATNGDIGIAGARLMEQKAAELKIQEKKKQIEESVLAIYRPSAQQQSAKPTTPAEPAVKATAVQQSQVVTEQATQPARGATLYAAERNAGQYTAAQKEKPASKSIVWIIAVAVIVLAAVAIFLLGGNSKKAEPQTLAATQETQTTKPVSTTGAAQAEKQSASETAQTAGPATENAAKPTAHAATPAPVAKPASTNATVTGTPETPVQETAPAQTNVLVEDENYNTGMKAYEKGDGSAAIEAFKKSSSASSYYMIGLIYEKGCGNIGKNDMLSRQNYKKAASLGSIEAKAKL